MVTYRVFCDVITDILWAFCIHNPRVIRLHRVKFCFFWGGGGRTKKTRMSLLTVLLQNSAILAITMALIGKPITAYPTMIMRPVSVDGDRFP